MTVENKNQNICPSWCTRDHAAGVQDQIDNFNEMVDRCGMPDSAESRASLDEDIAGSLKWHTSVVGGEGIRTVEIDDADGTAAIVGETAEAMTASDARTYARALLAAADKLDAINAEVSA